jgi:protein phosphatase
VGTRALAAGDANPDVWEEPIQLEDGDALLLISDGVHDLVQPEEILKWVSGVDYRDAVESLVRLANERGGTDNITAAIAVVGAPHVGGTALAYEDRRTPQPAENRATVPETPSPLAIAQKAKPVAPTTPPAPVVQPSSAVPIAWVILAVAAALVVGSVCGFVGRGLVSSPPAIDDVPAALP